MSVDWNQTGDAKKVPDEQARRLLARATEIDSAQSAELSLSELRAVALEAGIAPNAFEQAVIELGVRPPNVDPEPVQSIRKAHSRSVRALLESARTIGVVAATLLVLMLMFVVLRLLVP